MPNDLVVRPIPPVLPQPLATRGAAPAPAAAPSANALPNPTMRLDPALGLVVVEFRNQAGDVTTSIPGPRQLDAYRTARDSAPGVHPLASRMV